MPAVFPFRALQFQGGSGDVSEFVAPPYDVIDANRKASLIKANPANVVGFDLPHTPAKELGPPAAYQSAADQIESLLNSSVLDRREAPAMFAYRQTFEFGGESYQRCGMCCTIETVPFGSREGGGVLPHEQTFSGPKEDRLALMRATSTQLSPIFGLHADEDGDASGLVRSVMEQREPNMTARLAESDGQIVLHEVWTIDDESTIAKYRGALDGEDVFIADGHHRYNTALNYLSGLEEQGEVAQDHAARRCMIVLVGMSDPGLAIGPTHRVLGGMSGYTPEQFIDAAAGVLDVKPVVNDPAQLESEVEKASLVSKNAMGLYDFGTGLCWVASPSSDDPLSEKFPDASEAWRTLDVAIIQHAIVEEVCSPELNGGEDVTWAFPHSVEEMLEIGKGATTGSGGGAGFAQLGIVVRATPLEAVRDVSKAGELMPQKSTFFYPKLATGLFMHPLA